MVKNALSVQVWAGGHSGDSAEAVEFAELNGIDCVIERYRLEDARQAYGMSDTFIYDSSSPNVAYCLLAKY